MRRDRREHYGEDAAVETVLQLTSDLKCQTRFTDPAVAIQCEEPGVPKQLPNFGQLLFASNESGQPRGQVRPRCQ